MENPAEAALGDEFQAQVLDFGARYVLQLAGDIQCERRSARRLMVWRLFSLPPGVLRSAGWPRYPGLDATAIYILLANLVNSPPQPWTVELLHDTMEFRYKDLQRAPWRP